MTDHQPMPVKGYTPQSDDKVQLANRLKEAEERYLRMVWPAIDEMEHMTGIDWNFIGRARGYMQTANMFAVRAIFQPTRIKLPEDGA